MLYVGGGAGMAPMRSHLYELFKTMKTGRKVTYLYGGRSKEELFYIHYFRDLEKEEYEKVIDAEIKPTTELMTMGEVLHKINEHSDQKNIVVTDVGQHQMIACSYAKFKQTRSMITSGGLGTMGFCLPAAIGAKMGTPDAQVIGVIGDGSFQMTIQELGTIFQTKTAGKIAAVVSFHIPLIK